MSARQTEIGRAFLVGSPRSGTTLLQSLLFAHPSVISFPETFFFAHVVPGAGERWRRRARLASARAPAAVEELDALGVDGDGTGQPALPVATLGRYARLFTRRMDAAARRAGASLWLEKTPDHVRYVAEIERYVPGAKIIHLIRAGEAVVASLYDVRQKHPEIWRIPGSPLELVDVWRSNLYRSRACIGRPNHVFVSYERLVDDPEAVLRQLCAFLDLSREPDVLSRVLDDYRSSSEHVTGRLSGSNGGGLSLVEEPWKTTVAAPITNRNGSKFRSLFNEVEQAEISSAVAQDRAVVESFPYL